MFEPDVAYEDALAGTVAAWLERQQPSYAVAPPVLRSYGDLAELEHGSKQIREQRAHARRELRVLDLGLRWFLPPAQSPD